MHLTSTQFALGLIALASLSGETQADDYTAIAGIPKIVDGDTLIVDGETVDLRGIDAPELRQTCIKQGLDLPCGYFAAEALAQQLVADPTAAMQNSLLAYLSIAKQHLASGGGPKAALPLPQLTRPEFHVVCGGNRRDSKGPIVADCYYMAISSNSCLPDSLVHPPGSSDPADIAPETLVWCSGTDLATAMVGHGMALVPEDSSRRALAGMQEQARNLRRGLWEYEFEFPWVWRRKHGSSQ